ncbi:hypothetical protein [Pedobacter sp. P26]|uniref:hypothetical protein n=1 Tax=Pedobacter sp. P26 TaxID=3423956 RepID=UPI003D67F59B
MPRFAHFLYLLPLTVSAIISIKALIREWAIPFKWFSVFLLATMVVEWLAVGWKLFFHQGPYWDFPKSNLWIYNLYIIPEYLFYLVFFCKMLESQKIKKAMWPFGLLYFLFAVINVGFVQGLAKLNTYTIIFGGLITVVLSSAYFLQELNRKNPQLVHKQPLFWIATGVLVFHSVSLPNFIFMNYLSRTNLPLAIALFNILLVLNILMYSFYLIAFLCHKPIPKKLS